ncbi:MAG: hypothetical protein VX727_05970 [Planctomycetota bacterium]|nr:hypothetical protein [Planctomycetota bacterium]
MTLLPTLLLVLSTAAVEDPFAGRLDEESYLRALGRLQLTDVLDLYLDSRGADDPRRAAEFQIAALDAAMREPGLEVSARRALLDRRIDVRRGVLATDPDAATELVWSLGLAEDHLLVGLGMEHLGLSAMHGATDAERTDLAVRHVDAGRTALDRAEIALEKSIWSLEEIPASRRTAAQRNALVDLRETQRDRRLPLLRGIALVHAAMLADDAAEADRLMADARDALTGLPGQLDGAASPRASWLLGMAMARSGDYEAAEVRFRDAATHDAASRQDVLAARLGGVFNRVVAGGPERGIRSMESIVRRYDAPGDRAERILVTEVLVDLHLRAGATSDPSGHEARAVGALLELGSHLNGQGLDPAVVDAFVQQRIEALPIGRRGQDHLPPEAALVLLTRTRDASGIRALLARTDLTSRTRVRTLLLECDRLEEAGRMRAAAEAALEAAELGEDVSEGGDAAERAARLAMAGLVSQEAEANRLADRALRILCTKYPERPGIDEWRLAAARLAMQGGDLASARSYYESIAPRGPVRRAAIVELSQLLRRQATDASTRRTAVDSMRTLRLEQNGAQSDAIDLIVAATLLDGGGAEEAAAVLDTIERSGLDADRQAQFDALVLRAASGDAGAMAAAASEVSRRGTADGGAALVTALSTALQELDERARTRGDAPDADAIAADLLPIAESLEYWLQEAETDDPAAWTLVADARGRSGEHAAALAIYERLLVSHPSAGSLLAGRAQALFDLGGTERLAESMGIYRRLASAGMQSSPRRWWIAQLRMLQILDAIGRNTDQIAPRIRRLQQQDPSLGGADTRRAFEGLLVRYGS